MGLNRKQVQAAENKEVIRSGMRYEMMPRADSATNLFSFSSRAKQFFTNSTAEEAIKDAKKYILT